MNHFKGLSRAQKAAAILVAMGKQSAGGFLKFFMLWRWFARSELGGQGGYRVEHRVPGVVFLQAQ
jgi:hypothetical protein